MVMHLMVSEDVENVKDLSVKNRRRIMVKKITSMLLKEEKIIKAGQLYKRSDRVTKNMELYVWLRV